MTPKLLFPWSDCSVTYKSHYCLTHFLLGVQCSHGKHPNPFNKCLHYQKKLTLRSTRMSVTGSQLWGEPCLYSIRKANQIAALIGFQSSVLS